jgi:HEAT repeats/PBS lyase HEAT-like repeat
MVSDPNPKVRDAAVRSLGRMGGRRAVEALTANAEHIPLYRLAISLSQATSDVDIEALMRAPANERAAVATVLACGLRCDHLRVPPLLGIAHDRRWPAAVRVAACKALATIGELSAADGLKRLALYDPDGKVKEAADRAHRRLVKRVVAK